jgi:polyprenyl P-hydroxybenzoate/phenylacrylic acid decarboxylase-like protein
VDTHGKKIIVGITGASGAAYAQRTVQLLLSAGVQTHLVVTPLGQRLLHDELGMEGVNLQELAGAAPGSATPAADTPYNLIMHNYRDVGASIASGSFRHDGMIVIPCSSNSLSCIANGSAQNLLHRAAHVTLKERRRLVLVHREMPLSLIDIRNMQAVTEAGGIIAPASPGFYLLPQTVEALIDFVVGRCLDLLDIQHDLNVRWSGKMPTDAGAADGTWRK